MLAHYKLKVKIINKYISVGGIRYISLTSNYDFDSVNVASVEREFEDGTYFTEL